LVGWLVVFEPSCDITTPAAHKSQNVRRRLGYIYGRLYMAKVAGFKDNEKGTMELYKQGLNHQLLNNIINNYAKQLTTLEEWQKEACKHQVHWLEAKNLGQGLTPKQMQ
jgi:hypothetical protein